jgi:hypothetical protein
MKQLPRVAAIAGLSLIASAFAAGAETFYLNVDSGDDTRSGTAPEKSWKTLERVNRQKFRPGDHLLFKAGTRYRGQLRPQGSGVWTNGQAVPITLGKYGGDALPRIDGDGKFVDALLIRNAEFWEVQDLEITNLGTNREPWRSGIRIVNDGFGTMRHIHLKKLFVHDVNGDLNKNREGCGIFFESRGANASRFDDLLIENCHVVHADRNGICQRSSSRGRSTGVVIRGNLLEDIGGDGIKVWGSDGALIERNVLRGGRTRCDDYAAGIWPWDSDDTIIQFNEVSGMKGTKDGQGFDSDYRCRRSVFQYNYSHDNEGGFFLICTPGNSYCEDTIIRYNISQHDGINSARVFQFGGGAKNTRIYNNTIYLGPEQKLPLVKCTDWSGGNAEGTRFFNNIFYVDGSATYDWGKSHDTVFENNIFYGGHVDPPPDAHAITNRPALLQPGSAKNGFDSLVGYKFRQGTEIPRGKIVTNNGGRDLFGTPVASDKPPYIGAIER